MPESAPHDFSIFYDLTVILTAGFIAGAICRRLGVSMLIGYLLVGTLLGHGALNLLVDRGGQIELLAEVGVVLLLFSIGLEFTLNELRRLWKSMVIGGSLQMLLVAVPVTVVEMLLGMAPRPSILIGGAVALSSTVLVFKALSEYGQTASAHGRRAISILLFQDAALVPLLLLIPLLIGSQSEGVGNSHAPPGVNEYVWLGLTSILLVLSVLAARLALARWMVPLLVSLRSPELVVLFTLIVVTGLTVVAQQLGLPLAVGAFAAGLIFSGNRLTAQVNALILPFREAFSAVFFVSLGLLLDFGMLRDDWFMILVSLILVVLLKSTAATIALRATGLPWKPSLGMGMGLSQIGEFSFVVMLTGLQAGLITEVDYNRLLCFALASLILTPQLLKWGLRLTESHDEPQEESIAMRPLVDCATAVVVGAGPVGRRVASRLEIAGIDVCLVDMSTVNLHPFAQHGFRTVSGDASDPDVLARAGTPEADLLMVCLPDDQVTIRVLATLKHVRPAGPIICRCRYQTNIHTLERAGANHVISEETEASEAMLKFLDRIQLF